MEKRIKLLFIFPTPQVWGGEGVWLNLLRRINRKKFSISVLTFGTGKLLKRLEDINVKYYSLEKARLRNVFGSVKNLFRMIKFLKKEKFDIVNSLGVHLLSTLSTSVLNIRYILHIHTIHSLPLIDRWCLRRARHVVTVSNFSKQLLIGYGVIKEEYIHVIYNGIDIEEFEKKVKGVNLRKELRLHKDTQIVCYIGRIVKAKNLKMLVQTIPKIEQDYQGRVKFLFVGDSPKINIREPDYKDNLLKLAEELGVENDIIFTGRREDVVNILKQINIFAIPSLLEVCSMAILEAMTMAKPVLAIRAGGNPELVSEETGILVNPNDLNGFAKGIIKLLKDKEKAFMIGRAGKRRVKEYFSIEKNVKMTEELYEEILSRNIL